MIPLNDTIAAIATPIGEGGISVIRISGPLAIETADKSFRGKNPLCLAVTHTAHFGKYVSNKAEIIDDVVVTVFIHPQSYTGEDVVEISCHGGILVAKTILSETIANGARLAFPGEFTKRAFLNGKIDLSQAEAVADLIQARSEAAHLSSMMQLQGRLSNEVSILRKKLTGLLSLIELGLDFTEEDLNFASQDEITNEINEVESRITKMLESYSVGRIYKEGVRVVFAGKPNVGKSSVLNRLLDLDRAIVTDIPGTTRDVIEESMSINGINYILVDTAGLRDSVDLIEREGIIRSEKELVSADILLFILDLTSDNVEVDKEIYSKLLKLNKPILIVGNKCDVIHPSGKRIIHHYFSSAEHVIISARTGIGIDDLRNILTSIATRDISRFSEKSFFVNNLRHVECLRTAMSSLAEAKKSLTLCLSAEFISVDMHKACNNLGEIIGEVTNEDLLNEIFSRFCIGK